MLYRTEFSSPSHKKALSDSGLVASISNSQLSFHMYAYFDMSMHSYANVVAYLILGRQHHCPIEPFCAAKPFSPSDRAFLCMNSLRRDTATTPRTVRRPDLHPACTEQPVAKIAAPCKHVRIHRIATNTKLPLKLSGKSVERLAAFEDAVS